MSAFLISADQPAHAEHVWARHIFLFQLFFRLFPTLSYTRFIHVVMSAVMGQGTLLDLVDLVSVCLGMSRYVLLSQWQVLAKRPWFQMERLLEITPQSVLESPKLINDTRTTRERHTKTRHVGHVGLYKRQDTTKPLWWIHAVLSLFHVGSKHIKTCQNIRSCLDVWRSSARHGQTERQWWWRCNFRLQKRIWNSVKQCKAM